MNFKTTGLLVGLLVIVVVVWYLFPKSTGTESESAKAPPKIEEQKPVFDPPPKDEQIVRVELERPGKPRLVFERIESTGETPRGVENWRALEPAAVPADGYKVIGLARTLTSLQARDWFEPGSAGQPTVAEAGLEPAAATVTLVDKEGKRYALEVGKKAVMSSDTYVRVGGQKSVAVATRDLLPQVSKDLKDFRAQRLLQFSLDDTTDIRVTHAGQTYDLSRTGGGDWVINEPVRSSADGAKVREKLLTPLNALQAAEFVDETSQTPTEYGLDDPYLTLSVTTEQKPKPPLDASQPTASQPASAPVLETHRLVVGGFADLKSERRYVKVDAGPGLVIVKQTDLANLVPKLGDLRDPHVTHIKVADVTELTITAGDTAATLKKVNGVWQGSGDLAQLDPAAVQDVVDALAGLTAINYIDQPEAPPAYGLDRPRAVLTVTSAGQVAPVTLRMGSETASGKNAYVQVEGSASIFVVAEAQAARLAVNPVALRARDMLTFPPPQLRSLHVVRGKSSYELTRAGENWTMTAPPDAPVDATAVRSLALDLSHLRAKRVVAKGDDAAYGLDHPTATLTFDVGAMTTSQPDSQPAPTSAPVQHTLRIALKDNAAYARKDDDPYVFELDETVYHVLTAELIDPRIFSFKPEEVARVKTVGTGGAIELVREDNRWEYGPDRFVELAQNKVQDFVRDIAQMRAESYMAYRDGDLAAAGLANAPASLTVQLSDGREIVMSMAPEKPRQLPRVAGLAAERRIFLLQQADAEKLARGLDEYVKSDKPETPPPGAPPPGAPTTPVRPPPRPPRPSRP